MYNHVTNTAWYSSSKCIGQHLAMIYLTWSSVNSAGSWYCLTEQQGEVCSPLRELRARDPHNSVAARVFSRQIQKTTSVRRLFSHACLTMCETAQSGDVHALTVGHITMQTCCIAVMHVESLVSCILRNASALLLRKCKRFTTCLDKIHLSHRHWLFRSCFTLIFFARVATNLQNQCNKERLHMCSNMAVATASSSWHLASAYCCSFWNLAMQILPSKIPTYQYYSQKQASNPRKPIFRQ